MSSSKNITNFIKIGTAGNDDNNKRTDRIIRKILPSLSLGSIYKEIRLGRIRINGEKTFSESRINSGDSIFIHKSLAESLKTDIGNIVTKKDDKLQPTEMLQSFSIEVLFENDHFIALNKPAGMLIHTGSKTCKKSETLDCIVKKLLIEKINDMEAAKSTYTQAFLAAGFVPDRGRLYFW